MSLASPAPSRRSRRLRHGLLAGSALFALGLSAASAVPVATSGPVGSDAIHDLSAVAAAAPIDATIWLKPHDEAGFEAAIAARTDPASPYYHRWMTDAELASYGPQPAQVRALVASLRAQGLTVTSRGANGLRVSGAASRVQSAFHTALRQVAQNGRSFRMATTTPSLGDGQDALVGSVTGLDNYPVRPLIAQQIDIHTGKPVRFSTAAAADPSSVFTTSCFTKSQTLTLTLSGNTASVTGPVYAASGVAPATKTCGYGAADVVKHYGVDQVQKLGYQGQNQTIVIIDAIGSPNIQADANTFSTMMGLPKLTSANFQIVYPDGTFQGNPYGPSGDGWPGEVSLDVEWAHAIAPRAKIVLLIVPQQTTDEFVYGIDYATSHHLGEVISNSYSLPEFTTGPQAQRAFNSAIARAAAQGIAVNASSGDSGDNGITNGRGAVGAPSNSPYATAIGGTSLGVPSDDGAVESAWGNDLTELVSPEGITNPPTFDGFYAGSGGGSSNYLPKPSWQKSVSGVGRQVPDISAIADPFTGGIFVSPNDTGSQSVVGVIGGTSLSCPVFSAMWALADQMAGKKLGQAAPILYRMPQSAFTDIVPVPANNANLQGTITVSGTSTFYAPSDLLDLTAIQPSGFVGTGIPLDNDAGSLADILDLSFGSDSTLMAQVGWDNATGLGVPNGLDFFKAAVAQK